MNKLSWMENLMKVDHPLPTPEPAPKLDMFSDLFGTGDSDGTPLTVQKSSKFSEDGFADVRDPVDELIKTTEREKFGLRAMEKRADTDDDLYARRVPALEGFVEKAVGAILGVSEQDQTGEDPLQKAVLNFGPPRWPNPSSSGYGTPPVRPDLDLIDAAWEELLGSSAYPERKPEVAEPSKKAAGGETLAKGEISSRMFGVLAQLRSSCEGNEAELIEKSIRALDTAAFAQLTEAVIARMKKRAA